MGGDWRKEIGNEHPVLLFCGVILVGGVIAAGSIFTSVALGTESVTQALEDGDLFIAAAGLSAPSVVSHLLTRDARYFRARASTALLGLFVVAVAFLLAGQVGTDAASSTARIRIRNLSIICFALALAATYMTLLTDRFSRR